MEFPETFHTSRSLEYFTPGVFQVRRSHHAFAGAVEDISSVAGLAEPSFVVEDAAESADGFADSVKIQVV